MWLRIYNESLASMSMHVHYIYYMNRFSFEIDFKKCIRCFIVQILESSKR